MDIKFFFSALIFYCVNTKGLVCFREMLRKPERLMWGGYETYFHLSKDLYIHWWNETINDVKREIFHDASLLSCQKNSKSRVGSQGKEIQELKVSTAQAGIFLTGSTWTRRAVARVQQESIDGQTNSQWPGRSKARYMVRARQINDQGTGIPTE